MSGLAVLLCALGIGACEPDPVRCPADATNCASATGEIVYVEAVDPDGDGDAHFVLAGSESITAPGITVVDVAEDLRPHPLPGVGRDAQRGGAGVSGLVRPAPDRGDGGTGGRRVTARSYWAV